MKSQSQYFRYFTYIKPFAKNPAVKSYGSIIFALVTISILTFFAIKPTVSTILVLQKQLADQEEVLKKVTDKTNNLSLGKKNYDNLDPIIKNKISTAIPDKASLKSLTQNLEEAAKIHEASISALQIQPVILTPDTPGKLGSLSEISFVFNTEGTYQNLIALLQEIQRSSRLIAIENLSLSKTSDDKSIIMSLSGKVYYLKQ